MHDRHRDTDIGKAYLEAQERPKLRSLPEKQVQPKVKKGRQPKTELTRQELQVVELMIDGYTTKQIAILLDVSEQAVSSRTTKAKRKVKARTLYHLVAIVQLKLKEGEYDGGHRRKREEGDREDRPDHASESGEAA